MNKIKHISYIAPVLNFAGAILNTKWLIEISWLMIFALSSHAIYWAINNLKEIDFKNKKIIIIWMYSFYIVFWTLLTIFEIKYL